MQALSRMAPMWPQWYNWNHSFRQPCNVSLSRALSPVHWWWCYPSVPISGVAVCFWMPLQAHCNHSGWCPSAQGKPKASLFENVWMIWDVLCSMLVCHMSWASQQNQAALDCIPGAVRRHQLITLSCAHQIQSIFRGTLLAWGEFSEVCVWVSATWLLLTLMGVTLLETDVLPLGLHSPLGCADCSVR